MRPTGPRLERHDHFEFQCSVYDLYNPREHDIDKQSQHDDICGEFIDNVRDLLNDEDRAKFDDFFNERYQYNRQRDIYVYRNKHDGADDVSG